MKFKIKFTKKPRLYIATLIILAFIYVLLKYSVTYLVVSSINSSLDVAVKNKVKLSNVSFNPATLNLTIKDLKLDDDVSLDKLFVDFNFPNLIYREVKFKASASINGAKSTIGGKVSYAKVDVNFELSNFDLNVLNLFIDKEVVGFGKVRGKLSSKGSFYVNDDEVKLNLDNLKLQNLFLYSKDLEVINYFAKEFEVKNLKITSNSAFLKAKSPSLNISNLMLSVPSKNFKDYRLSEFAKIEIGNIDVDSDKKNLTIKGFFDFKDGGFFALNKYQAENKDVVDIKLSSTDLTQFSSAFEPLLNYQIKSGKMSLDAKIYVDNKEINGNVKINLSQLGLDSENELGKEIENQTLMPLRTAIFFIQDDDGNIDLDFDLHGDKNDPNFSALGILGKGAGSMVISKINSIVATKVAVRFTPMLVSSLPLSPSNVYSVASGAYKMVTKPRFKDIEFARLEDDIKESSEKDLAIIVDFLKKNKEVKLNICPIASTFEFDNQKDSDKKALLLANERVNSLTKYFKKNNDDGTLKQVIFCRPKVSDSKEVAKAEISI